MGRARSCADHRAIAGFRIALHRPLHVAEEGERWGFFSRIVAPDEVLDQAEGSPAKLPKVRLSPTP